MNEQWKNIHILYKKGLCQLQIQTQEPEVTALTTDHKASVSNGWLIFNKWCDVLVYKPYMNLCPSSHRSTSQAFRLLQSLIKGGLNDTK